eukprot:1178657-Prorocentrum_minimum.AAC.1
MSTRSWHIRSHGLSSAECGGCCVDRSRRSHPPRDVLQGGRIRHPRRATHRSSAARTRTHGGAHGVRGADIFRVDLSAEKKEPALFRRIELDGVKTEDFVVSQVSSWPRRGLTRSAGDLVVVIQRVTWSSSG